MNFDVVIPLKTSLLSIAITRTIPSIISNISYDKIYILTKKSNFKELESTFKGKITCLDEDEICKHLTLDNIKEYFKNRNENPERAGWYFQQFLKLSVSKLHFISNLYLVWDADAVALNPINFFTQNNKIYFEKNKEFHEPYFEIIEKILDLKKQVSFSFIAEHLVFNKKLVITILNKISKKETWWLDILDNITSENLSKSGFSEYELYGNYVSKFHKNEIEFRHLNKTRKGIKYLGEKPSIRGLKLFSSAFDYMSFERWHKKYKPLPLRYMIVFFVILFGWVKKYVKLMISSFYSII
ncbi:MAG: DUF6492 family protein [Polaribacter sp.]|uniref:DUF6492 family protein n=1 Tax=Polaribacter sp. TaxID=1920175 RepID=UPI002619CE3A|nr:DUF6492 family protein [uncultured Polaribacter sp.]